MDADVERYMDLVRGIVHEAFKSELRQVVREEVERAKGPPSECCHGCAGPCAVTEWYSKYAPGVGHGGR